jgi:hypothetical protein
MLHATLKPMVYPGLSYGYHIYSFDSQAHALSHQIFDGDWQRSVDRAFLKSLSFRQYQALTDTTTVSLPFLQGVPLS